MRRLIPGAFLLILAVLAASGAAQETPNDRSVAMLPAAKAPAGEMRLGYFHGGRAHILYRILLDKGFAAQGVDVGLYSEFLNDSEGLGRKGFFRAPADIPEMNAVTTCDDFFGRVTGVKIIAAMERGELDGGAVGESSFLAAAAEGAPITAVAMLGHDTKSRPGKGVMAARGLSIESPQDLKGAVMITRRAGAGDGIFAREFIRSIGLVPDKDVLVIEDVKDDEQEAMLRSGFVDLKFGHLHEMRDYIEDGTAKFYRKMDWMNPELSQALLVFNNDYLARNPEKVKKLLRAYAKRIAYEKSLSPARRSQEAGFGVQMEMNYRGMNLPQFDDPPRVRPEQLDELQGLLVRYGRVRRRADLDRFINQNLLREALSEKE
jgi:ABC-type nitrate/sulfonate/bicarbonate transport system substrate-binding protein